MSIASVNEDPYGDYLFGAPKLGKMFPTGKSWLSLISDPTFATSHFQLSASPTNKLVLVNKYVLKSIDVDASLHGHFAHASLTLDFLTPQCKYRLEIRGSCRGFLCMLHNGTNLYLWNPSTGDNKQIPINDGFEFLCGLAYDNSTDDYLILSGFGEDVTSSMKLMIFSLRANKWKTIQVSSRFPYWLALESECFPKCGLFLNGSIHWIGYNHETSKNVIIAFDIKEMEMFEIAVPDDFIKISNNFTIYYDLLEVGGLIGAWMKDPKTVKIYVMQEYGVHSSWTKIIQFSVDPLLHRFLDILCLTKCGDIVGRNRGQMVKFNDKGQQLESMFSLRSKFAVYTESLLSLPVTDQT